MFSQQLAQQISWLVADNSQGDLQGHPQCRRKVITVGFPFALGICNLEDDGAWEPASGAGDVWRTGGDFHEFNSCWKVIMVLVCDRWMN